MDSVTGNALANKQVQYKFNNGKVATVKTDANGVVKIKISVSKYGNYAMQVNFLGDEHYKASSNNFKDFQQQGFKIKICLSDNQ